MKASFPYYAKAACSAAADTKWSRESEDRKGVGGTGEEGQGGGNGNSKDSSTEGGRTAGETEYGKIMIPHPSGLPPFLWPWI